MPSQNGGWLHHSQTFPPATPESGQQGPEDTIGGPKPGPWTSMYQARELVAQGHILGDEICTVFENGSNHGEKWCELERHLTNHSLSLNVKEKSQQKHVRIE